MLAAVTGRSPWVIRSTCARGEGGYDFEQAVAALDAAPDEPTLLTASEAERFLRIPANRIYQWAFRGQLRSYDAAGQSPLYDVADLTRLNEAAERRLRRRAQLDL